MKTAKLLFFHQSDETVISSQTQIQRTLKTLPVTDLQVRNVTYTKQLADPKVVYTALACSSIHINR